MSFLGKNVNKDTLRLYWEHIRKYRVSFFLMLICIPMGALLIDTFLPYFLSQAIGGLTEGNWNYVKESLMISGVIIFFGVIFNIVGFQAITRHEANVRVSLLEKTFSDLMAKDVRFFVNEKVGALTSRFIDFLRAHVALQDMLVIRTLGFLLSVGSGLIIIAFNSWILFLVVLGLIILLLVQVRWSIKKRSKWRHERKRLTAEIHGSVADAITNNLVVKTFAKENEEKKVIDAKSQEFKNAFMRDLSFVSYEGSVRMAVMSLIQIGAIVLAALFVFDGQMDIATAIFILTYLQRIASQIFSLGDMLNGYDQAFLDASPMTEILLRENEVVDGDGAEVLEITDAKIEFSDVSYIYSDGNENVLNNVSLSIPGGQRVGLVGYSGSGKTTITHLLLRFMDVTDGEILISGKNIRDVTQQSLRDSIAYVPQEPMLFHRTIKENIAYGKVGATDQEIEEAAKFANALEFIEKLPLGMKTIVGERGVKLSGGQKQRIAIARAILKNAPILILDEATSALDSESEKLIQDALDNLMRGRTTIVIAHRLSTIAKLDRLLVLEKGRIVEDGTHQELLLQGGIYGKLWKRQSGGFVG